MLSSCTNTLGTHTADKWAPDLLCRWDVDVDEHMSGKGKEPCEDGNAAMNQCMRVYVHCAYYMGSVPCGR